MNYIKTTIRIKSPVKLIAEERARSLKVTFQDILNMALEKYLSKPVKKVSLNDFIISDVGKLKVKKLDRELLYSDEA